ncbi:MAG TPA: hypothetical protein VK824_11515 [Planctomycetota bacterium]|nr:hypothetical protein [Planctomycetota bacterium]
MKLASFLLLLACCAAPGCKLVDIRTDGEHTGVRSDALLSGYATYGWPDQDSLLEIELLGGRSKGSLLMIDLWKIAQVEIGLLGASAGIGPLNAGLGVLFYEPQPPFGAHQASWGRAKLPQPPAPPKPPLPPQPPTPPDGTPHPDK